MIKSRGIKCLLKLMYDAGLKPVFFKKAASGSMYIKFGTDIGGSLRIGDHQQRTRYAYRWNLRKDVEKVEHREKLGHICHYYPFADYEIMIGDMLIAANEKQRIKEIGVLSVINILNKQGY